MEEEVLTLARELGGVGEGEAAGLPLCCTLAVEELRGMLKRGLAPSDCGGVFPAAAARMALADWMALQVGQRPRKFSAGEVTVEEGSADPVQLRRQALRQMARYLEDAEFFLQGVRS